MIGEHIVDNGYVSEENSKKVISQIYRDVLARMLEAVMVIFNGKIVFVNQPMEFLLGYSRDELKELNLDGVTDLFLSGSKQRISPYLNGTAPLPVIDWMCIKTKNTEPKYVSASFVEMLGGHTQIILSDTIDIKNFLDTIPDMVYEFRVFKPGVEKSEKKRILKWLENPVEHEVSLINCLDTSLTYINKKSLDKLYLDPINIGNTSIIDLIDTSEIDSLAHKLFEIIKQGKGSGRYKLNNPKHGGYIRIDTRSNLIINEYPFVIRGTARDISIEYKKMKKLQKEKEDLQKQSFERQQNEAVSHVTKGIAKNINDRLQIALSYIEMSKGELSKCEDKCEDKHKLTNYIEGAANSCDSCGVLVKDLMLYSRLFELRLKECSINEVLSKVTSTFSSQKITLLLGTTPNILIDIGLLEMAFNHLCKNAIEAISESDNHSLIIHTSLEDDKVKISFRDNGPGIPDDIKDDIFKPFITTKDKRIGMGLSITEGIIKEHGGNVKLDSYKNGCDFIVTLPIKINKKEKDKEDNIDGNKKNILIINNEEVIRNCLKLIFEKHNYIVDLTSNGSNGYDIIKNNNDKYDLVLLDVDTSETSSGIRTLQNLMQCNQDLKVIIMTGDSNQSESVFKSKGAIAIIQKPILNDMILKIVDKILN